MQKGELLYEGKAKKVYRTENRELFLVEFKDDATAFNGQKKGTIRDKGELNNKISAHLFRLLEREGIATHFVEQTGDREMLVKALEIIPVEVVVRNIAAGSLARRLGLDEGTPMARTVVEYYYKSDELGDPLINDDHIAALNLAGAAEMAAIRKTALAVNDFLRRYMDERNLILVDFKLEFGRHSGRILLGDEISPDTCRFWDKESGEKLDKDRFRRDLGGVEDAYREVWKRLGN